MLINKRLEEPFDKIPKDDILPIIPQTMVNSKLTPKFWQMYKKFINIDSINLKYIYKEKENKTQNIPNENLDNNQINEFENKSILNNNNNTNNNNNDIDILIDNLDNINIDDINLNDLKKITETLQKELSDKEVIISYQKEEAIKLRERIENLQKQLSSQNDLDK